MDKWEYKVIELSYRGEENEPKLNDLGNAGWELVSVTPYVGSYSSCVALPFAYLKRRKN